MATTFETKTWVDRVSEYPARRTLTDTSGNATVYTVTRNEGTVSEEGDAFSAENMNDLESRIATAVDAKLDGTTLVSDYDTAVTTTTTGTAPDCTVIAEMYQNFTAGCSVIAAALNSAGVATASNASPSVMAAAIATVADNQYTSGYAAAKVGTANASHVLSGYTFTNAANVGATGNMSNRGNVTVTLNCGNSYTIASGYHGGGGTVTANSLSSQTVGNITAARVLNGYVGWANGTKYTGSMNNWGSNTVNMSSNTATLSAGYYSSITINAASRYTAGYNAAKVGNATAARVLNGYTFTNSANVGATGTMNNWGSNTVNMSSNTATLSAGYYSSITINAASRYTAGYNAKSLVVTSLGYNGADRDGWELDTTSLTWNAASISGYANFTANNFSIHNVSINTYYYTDASGGAPSFSATISYNSSSGKVTLNNVGVMNSLYKADAWISNCRMYCYYAS